MPCTKGPLISMISFAVSTAVDPPGCKRRVGCRSLDGRLHEPGSGTEGSNGSSAPVAQALRHRFTNETSCALPRAAKDLQQGGWVKDESQASSSAKTSTSLWMVCVPSHSRGSTSHSAKSTLAFQPQHAPKEVGLCLSNCLRPSPRWPQAVVQHAVSVQPPILSLEKVTAPVL